MGARKHDEAIGDFSGAQNLNEVLKYSNEVWVEFHLHISSRIPR